MEGISKNQLEGLSYLPLEVVDFKQMLIFIPCGMFELCFRLSLGVLFS